jgi:hypothetical protein
VLLVLYCSSVLNTRCRLAPRLTPNRQPTTDGLLPRLQSTTVRPFASTLPEPVPSSRTSHVAFVSVITKEFFSRPSDGQPAAPASSSSAAVQRQAPTAQSPVCLQRSVAELLDAVSRTPRGLILPPESAQCLQVLVHSPSCSMIAFPFGPDCARSL